MCISFFVFSCTFTTEYFRFLSIDYVHFILQTCSSVVVSRKTAVTFALTESENVKTVSKKELK